MIAATLDNASGDRAAKNAARAFWLLAGLHLVLWTVVPLVVQPAAPLDMVEMRYWGHQWQLGYHKHPPLPGWIAEASAVAAGGHFWGVYLASQLGIVACLWAVWRLGREILPPWLAFLGAFLMETSFWYTIASVEYNNNVAMFPFWALAILFLYRAIENGSLRWWLATGAMIGLAMLCKYTAGLLALTIFVFLVAHPTARHCWRRPGPYLMILVAVLLFAPHVVWAAVHHFPSLSYAASRTHGGPKPWGHLLCPLVFTAEQLLVLIPTAIAIIPLAGFVWRLRKLEPAERFPRSFLLAMILGPFAIQTVLAGVCNVWLLNAYGSQFWMFTGPALLYCLAIRDRGGQSHFRGGDACSCGNPSHAAKIGTVPSERLRAACFTGIRCAVIGCIMLVAGAVHNLVEPYATGVALRIHCPSAELAAHVHDVWNRRYSRPLPVVAGDWWLAANIAFAGPSVPVIYGSSEFNWLDMSPRSSEWTDDAWLKRHGGILVWNLRDCRGDPRGEIRRRFPQAEILEPFSIPWKTGAKIPTLLVGIAVVPPSR
ncbi:MAG: glycosyltransferase family 39 protein [Thermoguttaceae bacterium]